MYIKNKIVVDMNEIEFFEFSKSLDRMKSLCFHFYVVIALWCAEKIYFQCQSR